MSHYDTLEVSPKASAETIRAAYKSLMQRYHPDRNIGDAVAAARAVAIQQAYEVLSDTGKRAVYDLGLVRMHKPDSTSAAQSFARTAPTPEAAMFPPVAIGVAVIITVGLTAGYLLRDTPQPVRVEVPQTIGQAAPRVSGRTMDLIREIEVIPLLQDDAFRTFTGHTLALPRLEILIGGNDEERSHEFIHLHSDELRQQLRDTLSQIPYETLLKDTAKGYIEAIAKEALNEYIRTNSAISPLPDVTVTPIIGSVEKVILPDSFDVK